MVGHHLPVVFPSNFGIEDQHLMDVVGSLQEVVKLDRASEGNVGVVAPQGPGVDDL